MSGEAAVAPVDCDWGCTWEATCDHGDEGVWVIHRKTEYAARRSLAAHIRHHQHPTVPSTHAGDPEKEAAEA